MHVYQSDSSFLGFHLGSGFVSSLQTHIPSIEQLYYFYLSYGLIKTMTTKWHIEVLGMLKP